ncbi:MAG: anthranilate synthase component I family protein [FCB group bacterium]|nr:anthranilate synthase component I family protein [FCB group bacterium]
MKSEIIPGLDPRNFFSKLSAREKFVAMTWRSSSRGWKRIIAFNPVAAFRYNGQETLELKRFTDRFACDFIFGQLSFELGYPLCALPVQNQTRLPLAEFHAYGNYIEFTPGVGKLHFQDTAFPQIVREINRRRPALPTGLPDPIYHLSITPELYREKINRIFDYIRRGDIYQVNFTHTLHAAATVSPRQLFLRMLPANPVSHAAYFEGSGYTVTSLSPERFIRVTDGFIETEPVKGTRPRNANPVLDKKNLSELLNSPKEQSELFMITDLLRNDLGKICRIGSVRIERKKAVMRLKNVFHTYSKITGCLKDGLTGIDALISMFPGGSVTGCPKRRAMEVIRELEESPREIYTGSMGYILPGGDLDFNIAIRTLLQIKNAIYLGMGGGITIDSNIRDEFDETLSKAKSIGQIPS